MKVTLVIRNEDNVLMSFLNGEPTVTVDTDTYTVNVQDSFDDAISHMDTNGIDYSGFNKTLTKNIS